MTICLKAPPSPPPLTPGNEHCAEVLASIVQLTSEECLHPETAVVLITDTTTIAPQMQVLSETFSSSTNRAIVGTQWSPVQNNDYSVVDFLADGSAPIGLQDQPRATHLFVALLGPATIEKEFFSILRLPLGQESMPAELFALINGTLLVAIADVGLRNQAHGVDNASYISLADGACLRHGASVKTATDAQLPFYAALRPLSGARPLALVPYRNVEYQGEPFRMSRDELHSLKSCARQTPRPCRVIHVGEYAVDWAWKLRNGISLNGWSLRDSQSDAQHIEPLHPARSQNPPPDGVGGIIYSFMQYLAQLPFWDTSLTGREILFVSLLAYSIRFARPHQPIKGSLDCLTAEALNRLIARSQEGGQIYRCRVANNLVPRGK